MTNILVEKPTVEGTNCHIGESLWLIQDYDVHSRGDEFQLVKATPVSDQVYVIAALRQNPAKKKNLFCDIGSTTFQDPFALNTPPKQKTVEEPESIVFEIPGYSSDAPLMDYFKAFSPNTPAARDLYMLYQSEIGEFETDTLGVLLEKVGLTIGDQWPDPKIQQMHIHLTASCTAASLMEVPPDPPGEWDNKGKDYEEMPEITPELIMEHTQMDKAFANAVIEAAETPRNRPGRPIGAKNRPKETGNVLPPLAVLEKQTMETAWMQYRMADMLPAFVRLLIDHPESFDDVIAGAKDMARRAVDA